MYLSVSRMLSNGFYLSSSKQTFKGGNANHPELFNGGEKGFQFSNPFIRNKIS